MLDVELERVGERSLDLVEHSVTALVHWPFLWLHGLTGAVNEGQRERVEGIVDTESTALFPEFVEIKKHFLSFCKLATVIGAISVIGTGGRKYSGASKPTGQQLSGDGNEAMRSQAMQVLSGSVNCWQTK